MAIRAARQPCRDSEDTACESSLDVLDRARGGDAAAARLLVARTAGPLRRWARGRLPRYARASANTEDVVQEAVVHALARMGHFEHRTLASLQAYLREAVRNGIRDAVRQFSRRGALQALPESLPAEGYSQLEQILLRERSERYARALRTLKPADRLAVIHRLEHPKSFSEIARLLGKSSPDAARMAVNRAIKRLADALDIQPPVTHSVAFGAGDREDRGPGKTSF